LLSVHQVHESYIDEIAGINTGLLGLSQLVKENNVHLPSNNIAFQSARVEIQQEPQIRIRANDSLWVSSPSENG
jgi:hypothetical protein